MPTVRSKESNVIEDEILGEAIDIAFHDAPSVVILLLNKLGEAEPKI